VTEEQPEAREVLAHLQKAALELVAAARSTLDLFEAALREPDILDPLISTAADVLRTAADLGRRARPGGTGGGQRKGEGGSDASSGVQRITVS